MFRGFVGFTAIETSFCAPGLFVTRYCVPNGIVTGSVIAARTTGGRPAVTTPDIGTGFRAGRDRIGGATDPSVKPAEAGAANRGRNRGRVSTRAVAMRTMCRPPVSSPPAPMDALLVLEFSDGHPIPGSRGRNAACGGTGLTFYPERGLARAGVCG